MPSPVPNNAKGVSESLRVRSLASDARLVALYSVLRAISREEGFAPTLAGIANQLNARGSKTRGTKATGPQDWNGPRVGEALERLGVNRTFIRRWISEARKFATDNKVSSDRMIHQLWQDWQWHEKTLLYDKGQGLTKWDKDVSRFVPRFVRPEEWVPGWEREPESNARMVPAAPPAARLVHGFFEAFTRDA